MPTLRNAAAVDHAANRHAVLGHPIEDDARVERRTLDGREQLVTRLVGQVPAERDSAEVWVHEHRAIAVVPRHTQQSRLAGAILIQPL